MAGGKDKRVTHKTIGKHGVIALLLLLLTAAKRYLEDSSGMLT